MATVEDLPLVELETAPPVESGANSFHVSLGVADLERSVRFYEMLFARPPQLRRGKYARFELDKPSLTLVISAGARPPGGNLNHVGLRMATSAELVEVQRRLEEAGIATQSQEGVECCYAKQTKFWATDPDGVLWELYILENDIDHSGFDDPPNRKTVIVDPKTWLHRLTDALPEKIPASSGELDEVRFEGTFNIPLTPSQKQSLLAEANRVLKPGGKVLIHGLIGDRRFDGDPKLPGLASMVKYIPAEDDLTRDLQAAGFEDLFYEKLGDVNCIGLEGIDLRSGLISARRPPHGETGATRKVLYRGPLDSVTDDHGARYDRGVLKAVDEGRYTALKDGPAADSFVFC